MDDGESFEIEVTLSEQGDNEYGGGREDDGDADDNLLRGLNWAVDSQRSHKRQSTGKSGLDTLRALASIPNPDHACSVLDAYLAGAYDRDERVRCEVIEYVPPLALFLSGDGSNGGLRALISSHLLPIVVKSLNDENAQVMKMAESALVTLLEHCLISANQIEYNIWPAILFRIEERKNLEGTIGRLTKWLSYVVHSPHITASFDERCGQDVLLICQDAYGYAPRERSTERRRLLTVVKVAVLMFYFIISQPALMSLVSKMALWIGRELNERLTIPLLQEMSGETELGVRRVCASLFRDICSVVPSETSESRLVPNFLQLCADPEWVVRQTCAEVFMSVSCKVTLATRKTLLAPAFAKLLVDRVRWVQLSAFQALGPFITTFAEPSITSLGFNVNGELVLKHQGASFEYKINTLRVDDKMMNPLFMAFMMEGKSPLEPDDAECNNNTKVVDESFNCRLELEEQDDPTTSNEKTTESEDEHFNTWQYWREPLPEIDIETGPEENTRFGGSYTKLLEDNDKPVDWWDEVCWVRPSPESDVKSKSDSKSPQEKEMVTNHSDNSTPENLTTDSNSSENIPNSIKNTTVSVEGQDIVPQELINHFVSMSDPRRDSAPDLAHHCAYNLPAVALTLGKENWELLKPAYETLAADRQWKVRRIVASSIHELAVIVGEDVATQDLVPVFNGFIKDLDEVRIGALKHLAHFLKLLKPAGRNTFLPRLTEFLMTDYDWNWRFRQELAEQLLQSLGLFTPADTCQHLGPVIMALLLDKVASVRKVALVLVTELVAHVSIDVNLLRSLLAELAEQFAHSSRWNRRQTFALLCSRLVKERVLSEEMFARDVLPHLLDLSWDPVANVRLAVARAAAQHILPNPYFADHTNPHHEVLVLVLKRLQADKDRDVRYFAVYQPPKSEPLEEHSINSSSEDLY